MDIQSPLFTDFYSLTMMQGYYLYKKNQHVVFDMFIRDTNSNMGYMVYAGLEPLLNNILSLRFSDEDIDFLRTQKLFKEEFLSYLKNFKFSGDIWSIAEGSLCFPYEPLLRVRAPMIEAQLLEGLILNTVNFQTLIATQASRMCYAAKGKPILEFGLRRAHGPNGALFASRAAYIGGMSASSNVAAGKAYGLPLTGTMAHSWIMSYESEQESFDDYAAIYPQNITLLLDTHNTLESGLQHAIHTGTRLKKQGIPFSVRLDSGDIEYLSRKVRLALDKANLHETKIVATNDLTEEIISQITASNAPIDAFGVGTNLVTGGNTNAMPGVYKLALIENATNQDSRPIIKTSNNIKKSSLPACKQVYRFYNDQYIADLITIDHENFSTTEPILFHHPYLEHKQMTMQPPYQMKPLLEQYIQHGALTMPIPSITVARQHLTDELTKLDSTYLRLINPHNYPVSISRALKAMRDALLFLT